MRAIVQPEDPRLRRRCRTIEPGRKPGQLESVEVSSVADDLLAHGAAETDVETGKKGMLGLHAMQLGEDLDLTLLDLNVSRFKRRAFHERPRYILVANLKYEVVDDTPFPYWEGCYTCGGAYGQTARPRRVHASGLLLDGGTFGHDCEGVLAVVVQHEYDHGQGRSFVCHVAPGKLYVMPREQRADFKDMRPEDRPPPAPPEVEAYYRKLSMPAE